MSRTSCFPVTPRSRPSSTNCSHELGGAGYRGVNITVPFKASAWQAASDASDEVVSTGVANTLLLGPAGPTNAFNTDFTGLQVGLPPTLRERVTGDRRAARRRRRRDGHRRGARRSRSDQRSASTTSSPTDRTHSPTCCGDRNAAVRVDVAGFGRRGGRRRRRRRQRNTCRDVPPARHTRRSRRDPRSAMALRRHLLADRDRADGTGRRREAGEDQRLRPLPRAGHRRVRDLHRIRPRCRRSWRNWRPGCGSSNANARSDTATSFAQVSPVRRVGDEASGYAWKILKGEFQWLNSLPRNRQRCRRRSSDFPRRPERAKRRSSPATIRFRIVAMRSAPSGCRGRTARTATSPGRVRTHQSQGGQDARDDVFGLTSVARVRPRALPL